MSKRTAHVGRGALALVVVSLCLGAVPSVGCAGTDEAKEEVHALACGELDKVTPQQWQAVFNAAASQLAAEGIRLDRSVWADAAKFSAYLKRFREIVNCPEPGPAPRKRVSGPTPATPEVPGLGTLHHADPGPDDFCGPNHGEWDDKHVSNCLNQVCFVHDSCYARCSEKTGGTECSWTTSTKPCDDAFFESASRCGPELGTVIASVFVITLARTLAATELLSGGCATGTQCPRPTEPGFGPCAKDRSGASCASCLAKNDPASACFKKACFDPGDPDICYTANCAIVSECFGWGHDGGGGAGSSGGAGAGGAAPGGGSAGAASGGKSGGAGTAGSSGKAGSGASGSAGAAGACSDAPGEPGPDLATAKELASESDCDGSSSVKGVIDPTKGDVDFYKFWGTDTFGCSVDPTVTVTAPGLKLCVLSTCAYNFSCSQATASPIGAASGCCATTPATISVSTDCNGGNDSAWIYMKVSAADPTAPLCAAYEIDYHY